MKKYLAKSNYFWLLCLALLLTVCLTVGTGLAKYMTELKVGSFNLFITTAEQAYAVYSANDNSLEFFYGSMPGVGGMSPNNKSVTAVYSGIEGASYLRGWENYAADITSVSFVGGTDEDGVFHKIQPKTMNSWFSGFENVTSFDFGELNTSNVTDMQGLFYACHSLSTLNVTGFDTSKTTNMQEMFAGCRKLKSINVSNFDTSMVSNMQGMFSDCYVLTSLNLSNFNTENVENMSFMFATDIDDQNKKLTKLTSLNLSNFNTANVTKMDHMFNNCGLLTSLDLSSFNTSKVIDMQSMFAGCNTLKEIFAHRDKWNLNSSLTASGMFNSCTALVGGNSTSWQAALVSATYAIIDGINGRHGYLTASTELDKSNYANVTVNEIENYEISFNNPAQHHYFLNDANTVTLTTDNASPYTGEVTINGTITVGADTKTVETKSTIDTQGKLILPKELFETTDSQAKIEITIQFLEGYKVFAIYSNADGNSGRLDFYFGAAPEVDAEYDGKTVIAVYEDIDTTKYTGTIGNSATPKDSGTFPGWHIYAENIASVSFHANVKPISTSGWFAGFINCTSFEGLEYLDTRLVTSMDSMFYNCKGLNDSDIAELTIDTAGATTVRNMFRACSGLNTPVLNFKNSAVENDPTETVRLTDLRSMFRACNLPQGVSGLTKLDLSKLYIASDNVNMAYMFYSSEILTEVIFPDREVLSFDTPGTTKTNYGTARMFSGCSKLTQVDISFIKCKTPVIQEMFANCLKLEKIYVDPAFGYDGKEPVNVFATCEELEGGNGTKWSDEAVNQTYARIDGKDGLSGYFTEKTN